MSHKYKISLLLIISLMLILLPACTNGADESREPSDTESKEEVKEELFSHLPDITFDGATITFLVEGDYMDSYKSVEIIPHEQSPELISSAVENRNNLVSDRFDVEFEEIRTESFGQTMDLIRNNHMGGTNLYDIVVPYIPHAATLAFEDYFYLLNDSEHIRMEMPYYDQGARQGLSINFKNYFLVGDFSILSWQVTHLILFNKDVVEENALESPYDLLTEGRWTIDKLQEMARKITSDSDGTPGMSHKDTFGYLANSNIVTSMYLASGEGLTGKDANDLPYLSVASEKGINVYNRIFDLINDKQATGHIEGFMNDATAAGTTVWELATQAVVDKRALFRASTVGGIADLGGYDCNFGVLPLPKYDEAQDGYHSFVSTIYATAAAIPKSNPEFERSAIILEAMSQASTDTVRRSYYDVLLKNRKIRDNESEEALDIIFDGRVYDIGAVFTWGATSIYDSNGIGQFMNEITFQGSNTFISKFDSVKEKIQSDLDDAIKKFAG